MGHRLARRLAVERVAHRVAAVTPDRRLDTTAARARTADHECEVPALELTAPDECLETLVRLLGTCDDHEAGRVAVEAVHDAGPVGFSTRDVTCEQPLDERARCVARRRVDDEPGRFVDDDQVVVFVGDPQVHLLRRQGRLRSLRRLELDLLATGQAMALDLTSAVDEHALRQDTFSAAPRADLGQRGQEAVEPLAGGFVRIAFGVALANSPNAIPEFVTWWIEIGPTTCTSSFRSSRLVTIAFVSWSAPSAASATAIRLTH